MFEYSYSGSDWGDEDQTPRRKLQRALFDLRTGRRLGYPLCCVLSYAIGPLLGASHNARRRGGCRYGRPNGSVRHWVPCRWHMLRGPNWQPYNAEWAHKRAEHLERKRRREQAEVLGFHIHATIETLAKSLTPDEHVVIGVDFGTDGEPTVVIQSVELLRRATQTHKDYTTYGCAVYDTTTGQRVDPRALRYEQ